ncbi:MAG: hypothetical protein GY822_19205 [Deltaproteobacteria bacterium]|nr:hypothetical protein [Deltaproteobacteria bacterium]
MDHAHHCYATAASSRQKKQVAVLQPIVDTGKKLAGTVKLVEESESSSKGVAMFTLAAQVSLSDGRQLMAEVTEPVGTPLPEIKIGSSATAWIQEETAVVSAADGLLLGKFA